MRSKEALNKIATLLNQPSFTSKEAQGCGVNAATLAHYVKSGELIRIGHGTYRKAAHDVVDDFRWEDLVEAVQKTKGTVCLISALSLYEMTEEIPYLATLTGVSMEKPVPMTGIWKVCGFLSTFDLERGLSPAHKAPGLTLTLL